VIINIKYKTLEFVDLFGCGGRKVEIGEGKSVDALKKAIKKEKKLFDLYDADELTIYLAKKDGHWLRSEDDDVSQLRKGNVPMGVRAKYFKPELEMNTNSLLR
jgi:hypothetical protein